MTAHRRTTARSTAKPALKDRLKDRRTIKPLAPLPLIPADAPAIAIETDEDLIRAAEAALFASGEPISIRDTARALGVKAARLLDALAQLSREYDEGRRGVCVRIFGESAQMTTRPCYAPLIRQLLQPLQRQPLSHHVLETLAVIAYHQPVTRAEIDQMRGVVSDSSVRTLLSRGLIRELGRRETLGRPMELGTTDLFLRHFGLTGLGELPKPSADGGTYSDESSEPNNEEAIPV